MAYGIEVYDASGNPTLTISDRVGFFIAKLTGTVNANSSVSIPISGINPSTTKAIYESFASDPSSDFVFDPAYVLVGTNQVTVYNTINETADYYIKLVRF